VIFIFAADIASFFAFCPPPRTTAMENSQTKALQLVLRDKLLRSAASALGLPACA